MVVNQQVVLQGVQEVTEEMDVPVVVQPVAVVLPATEEMEHTVLEVLHSPTVETEVTMVRMQFV
jgi:hypothetical protein